MGIKGEFRLSYDAHEDSELMHCYQEDEKCPRD